MKDHRNHFLVQAHLLTTISQYSLYSLINSFINGEQHKSFPTINLAITEMLDRLSARPIYRIKIGCVAQSLHFITALRFQLFQVTVQ